MGDSKLSFPGAALVVGVRDSAEDVLAAASGVAAQINEPGGISEGIAEASASSNVAHELTLKLWQDAYPASTCRNIALGDFKPLISRAAGRENAVGSTEWMSLMLER